MANSLVIPVILAGGRGTRLWPMSRSARPKQFLSLTGSASPFQETLKRSADACRYGPALVLTNAEYRFIVAEQAQELGAALAAVLLEPASRNTAPAIAAAASFVASRIDPEAVLHVLPSDHAVITDETYWQSVDAAVEAARAGYLVTFGIPPTAPETGYGYIRAGHEIGVGAFRIARFTEKPGRQAARRMIDAGNCYWNSGMFMMQARTLLEETRALAPLVHDAACGGVNKARADLDFVRIDEESFVESPDISIDYAIFEKSDRAAIVPSALCWSDLGAWDVVWKVSEKDRTGNAANGPVTFSNTTNSLVVSDKAHVAVEGLDDMAVIASEDAIFVGRLSQAQKVGPIVQMLRSHAATQALTEIHKTAYRPWGGYSLVVSGERFQVKRLFVKPGRKLSQQRHHHRSEHWIVVRGTAEVTIDGRVQTVTENQSVYLPLGCTHRLTNPGKILLELIEVQTGAYLGEDDIVRFEDEFGRA